MKLVMYGAPYDERPGIILQQQQLYDLEIAELDSPHSMEEILQLDMLEAIRDLFTDGFFSKIPAIPVESVRLGPPLSGLGKIIAVGLNYRAHAAEMGDRLPANPLLFAKAPTSLAGANDELELPPAAWSREVDYEVELGVVIGHSCHGISAQDARGYIAGYTIVNDVTARDIQRAESQWFRAKSYDGFCPTGPYLLTADELDDPQALDLWSRVNGEDRQRSNTSDMIYPVAELVSFISQAMTLHPGDLIATGTPSGIGAGLKPPCYLQPGDIVEMGITGLGAHCTRVVEYKE